MTQGLIFTQRGWTGAQITWTHALGAATYTVAGDVHNAYDVAVALRAWLDDAARPWAAAISSVEIQHREVDARVDTYFAFTGGTPTFVSIVGNATWDERYGAIAIGGGTPAYHSVWSEFGLTNWTRWDRSKGTRCRAGSWRTGLPSYAPQRPACEAFFDTQEAFMVGAALPAAVDPRTAYVWSKHAATWRWIVIDKLSMAQLPDDWKIIRCGIDCVGATAVG